MSALWLAAACSPEGGEAKTAVAPPATPAATPAESDDITGQRDPSIAPLGRFDLWEDVEGGRVCAVELDNVRTIGGYTLTYDQACVAQLGFSGEPQAWFPAEDGTIVLVDATRAVLVRFARHREDEYYAVRQPDGLYNLNLTR